MLLAGAGLLLWTGPASASGLQEEVPSLEELLRRARAQERALLARLEEPVRLAVRALENATGEKARAAAQADLLLLGPESAPLLIQHLVPGDEPTEAQRSRARAVGDALRTWGAPGVGEQLVSLALGDDKQARHQALRVLPRIPDRERARGILEELLAGDDQAARLDAARGLSELAQAGDAASVPTIRTLLFEEGASLVEVALEALAAIGDVESEPHVRRIAQDTARTLDSAPELLSYYTAVEDVPREPVALAILKNAAQGGLGLDERRELLELVAALDPSLNRDVDTAFKPLVEDSDPRVRDEARICMTLLGDRTARRELMRKFDDWVKARESWPSAYEDRAAIRLRIRDHASAAKDFQTAIELRQARNDTVPRELYVNLARARCLDGKIRQAHDALSKAYPSKNKLKELREDPDFRELAEHSRYGKIFDE